MSSPTMENNMEIEIASVGRSMDKSIHQPAVAKKQVSHRRYAIAIVVCIIIICAYLSFKHNNAVTTLVKFMWVVPSIMLYLYINKRYSSPKDLSSGMNLPVAVDAAHSVAVVAAHSVAVDAAHSVAVDAATNTDETPHSVSNNMNLPVSVDATTNTGEASHSVSIGTGTDAFPDDVFSIDNPTKPSLAFSQDMLNARREGLKKAPESVPKPLSIIDQLKQHSPLKPVPPKKPFEVPQTMWSQEVANGVNKRQERIENTTMGLEDVSA